MVFFPFAVTRMILAELRSETSASPPARKIRPHGTSKSSAIVPATSGFGEPVGVGVGVGEGVGVGVGVGEALVALGEALVADGLAPALGAGSSALQPATAARARPEEAYRNCRLVTTDPIVPGGACVG